jgi:hypothetical protein
MEEAVKAKYFISTSYIGQMQTYVFFQKSTFCVGVNFFNSLPCNLTILKNEQTKFEVVLRTYLNTHYFYSIDEFFMCKDNL